MEEMREYLAAAVRNAEAAELLEGSARRGLEKAATAYFWQAVGAASTRVVEPDAPSINSASVHHQAGPDQPGSL